MKGINSVDSGKMNEMVKRGDNMFGCYQKCKIHILNVHNHSEAFFQKVIPVDIIIRIVRERILFDITYFHACNWNYIKRKKCVSQCTF